MRKMYTAIYKKSGKHWVAWLLEVQGVNTQGKTKAEAKENLKDALGEFLAARKMLLRKQFGQTVIKEALVV